MKVKPYFMAPVTATMMALPLSYAQAENDANTQAPSSILSNLSDVNYQSLPLSGMEFDQLDQTTMSAIKQSASEDKLPVEFNRLVKQWKEETFALSSLTKIYAHPAYQRIIGMGTDGLPFVLKELQNNQGHWFYALKFMAGESGKDVAAGINNFEDAKAAWLEWGYKNNHI